METERLIIKCKWRPWAVIVREITLFGLKVTAPILSERAKWYAIEKFSNWIAHKGLRFYVEPASLPIYAEGKR